MPSIDKDAYYTLPQCSRLTGIHYRKFQRWTVAGKITYTRLGNYKLIRGADLLDTLRRYQQGDLNLSWRPRQSTLNAVAATA